MGRLEVLNSDRCTLQFQTERSECRFLGADWHLNKQKKIEESKRVNNADEEHFIFWEQP